MLYFYTKHHAMQHKYEIPPVKIPAGTVLPIKIWVWNVGQYPIVTVSSGGNPTTYTPLVVASLYRDPDDNLVQYVSIDPAPDQSGVTTEDYQVNVYPQNFL